MPSIKLKVQISGTRNGEEWPAPGTVVDLPDDEAAALIAAGLAVEPDDEEAAVAPAAEETSEPAATEETATAAAAEVETATSKPRGKA